MTAQEAIEKLIAKMRECDGEPPGCGFCYWTLEPGEAPTNETGCVFWAEQFLAALSAAGFVVVPREPTKAMIEAAPYPVVYNNRGEGIDPPPRLAWQRMVAAAQTPPADIPASGPQTARLCVKPDF